MSFKDELKTYVDNCEDSSKLKDLYDMMIFTVLIGYFFVILPILIIMGHANG